LPQTAEPDNKRAEAVFVFDYRNFGDSEGEPYGIERVCRVWDYPRLTFYHRCGANPPEPDAENQKPAKRGPKPAGSDEKLLTLIRKYPAGQLTRLAVPARIKMD